MARGAFVMASLVLATAAAAQQGAKTPPTQIEEADVERMNKAMTPGAMQQLLARLEGDWTYEVKSWRTPEGPPDVAQGTATKRMILDGRYLEEIHKGVIQGSPTEGRGITGWDNLAKEFQVAWVDNFSTAVLYCRGRLEADGKSWTVYGSHLDPMTELKVELRLVTRIVDADHHTFEHYMKPAGAPEKKWMEIRYTRKGKS
jgi:hypothetical protein